MFKGNSVAFMLKETEASIAEIQRAPPDDENVQETEIEAGQARIHRQFTNCEATSQFSAAFLSGACYGIGFGKTYVTDIEEQHWVEVSPGVWDFARRVEKCKALEYKSPFSMYWDMETPDLRTGTGVIERDYVSAYDLRRNKGNKFYLDAQIDLAIKDAGKDAAQGNDTSLRPAQREVAERGKNIEYLECWVRVPRTVAESFEKMAALAQETQNQTVIPSTNPDDESMTSGDDVEVFCAIAGRYVIAYKRLASPKERPYYMLTWDEDPDGLTGTGIADSLIDHQKVLNGAVRCYEDNKKLVSNVLLALKRRYLVDGDLGRLQPGKHIDITDDCDDVRKAIQQIVLQDVGENLLKMIELYLQFADLSSNLPRAEQGQQTFNPQTAFELQQRLEKSGKYIGRVIRNLDKFVRDVVMDFHDYNMRNPDLEGGKGDWVVVALGFSSFENRVIRLQKLLQLLNLVINSELLLSLVNVRWLLEEIVKALDLEPAQALKSLAQVEQEMMQRARAEQAAQATEAAKVEADTAAKQTKAAQDEERLKMERAKTVADLEAKANPPPGNEGKKPKEAVAA